MAAQRPLSQKAISCLLRHRKQPAFRRGTQAGQDAFVTLPEGPVGRPKAKPPGFLVSGFDPGFLRKVVPSKPARRWQTPAPWGDNRPRDAKQDRDRRSGPTHATRSRAARAPRRVAALGAAPAVGGGRAAAAVGAAVAGGAAAAQVAGPEDRQRATGPAGAHRPGRVQALVAGADGARPGRGRPGRRARPAQRQAHLPECRRAVAVAPGPGAGRAAGGRARAAPDAHGRGPLRHRRHPGAADGRARARPAVQAAALCAVQHRAAGRARGLRRPRGGPRAAAARSAPGAALHQQPAEGARGQGAAAAGLQPERQPLRLAGPGPAVRRFTPHRCEPAAVPVRPQALPGLSAGRPALDAAGRRGGCRFAPGLRADAPARAARDGQPGAQRRQGGRPAGRSCPGLRRPQAEAGRLAAAGARAAPGLGGVGQPPRGRAPRRRRADQPAARRCS